MSGSIHASSCQDKFICGAAMHFDLIKVCPGNFSAYKTCVSRACTECLLAVAVDAQS